MLARWLLSCIVALALPAVVFAAPPPECSCEVCLPDPTLKCKLPNGGQTTCGVFMRSGICLGEGFASVELQEALDLEEVPARLLSGDASETNPDQNDKL